MKKGTDSQPATKQNLQDLREQIRDQDLQQLRSDIRDKDLKKLRNDVNSDMRLYVENKFEDFEEKMDRKFTDIKSYMYDLVDKFAGELIASREEREISGELISRNTKRIEKLEEDVFGAIQMA